MRFGAPFESVVTCHLRAYLSAASLEVGAVGQSDGSGILLLGDLQDLVE